MGIDRGKLSNDPFSSHNCYSLGEMNPNQTALIRLHQTLHALITVMNLDQKNYAWRRMKPSRDPLGNFRQNNGSFC